MTANSEIPGHLAQVVSNSELSLLMQTEDLRKSFAEFESADH